jgi:tripartite-type tricarboxylate transporter receptor subunit TctC
MNSAVVQIQKQPEVREKLKKMGADVVATTPEQFGQFITAESQKWAKVIQQAGIKPQ